MKKVLIIGDSPSTPTGFSRVIENIFTHFPVEEYKLTQLGINYYGDPHKVNWDIYPCYTGGDVWGYSRVNEIIDVVKPDIIFILNDIWVIHRYLQIFKERKDFKIPVIIYYPVDGFAFDTDWFESFDLVSKAIVYTKFGYEVSRLAYPKIDYKIIPHGVDANTFGKLDADKTTIKKAIYPNDPEFYDNSFIVLNANRNQPRKRLDITMEGFAWFAQGKPMNVKLYMHMGLKDAGWEIPKLAKKLGMDNRLVVSNNNASVQSVTTTVLNRIYNATDVGVNTSIGEGWGLVSMEHGITGAPQIVPKHSACVELYEDCGLLLPISQYLINPDTLTVSGLVRPEDLAGQLQDLYTNEELYKSLSTKVREKFLAPKYRWENISKEFQEVFKECLQ